MRESLFYQLALALTPHVGPIIGKTLISYCGSPRQVFSESKKGLLKIPGIGLHTAREIYEKNAFIQAENEIEFIEKNGIQVHFYLEDSYPRRLQQIPDAPLLLFQKGPADLNCGRIISIVGTRKPKLHSLHLTERFLEGLPKTNLLVVSGLAYGVDIFAHKTCLQQGITTLGVLAHGLDRVYPPGHQSIAQSMLATGGLLSEFPSQTQPDRERFPMRNRIIAGLSDAMIMVESKKRGGSMISAFLASDYHREVFTFPARPNDLFASGNNLLLKNHRAHLIEDAVDFQELMGWGNQQKPGQQTSLFLELNDQEQLIWDLLSKKETLSLDQLSQQANFSITAVSSLLLEMEFKGIIRSLPGNQYALY